MFEKPDHSLGMDKIEKYAAGAAYRAYFYDGWTALLY